MKQRLLCGVRHSTPCPLDKEHGLYNCLWHSICHHIARSVCVCVCVCVCLSVCLSVYLCQCIYAIYQATHILIHINTFALYIDIDTYTSVIDFVFSSKKSWISSSCPERYALGGGWSILMYRYKYPNKP